ncbi:unnamed protein product [Rhizophagus irregularis]|nr:unnamed protein product [Rhizophagus irregularis]CAB5383638.1 unnamed protein product [Rhizophagus irregularis]
MQVLPVDTMYRLKDFNFRLILNIYHTNIHRLNKVVTYGSTLHTQYMKCKYATQLKNYICSLFKKGSVNEYIMKQQHGLCLTISHIRSTH